MISCGKWAPLKLTAIVALPRSCHHESWGEILPQITSHENCDRTPPHCPLLPSVYRASPSTVAVTVYRSSTKNENSYAMNICSLYNNYTVFSPTDATYWAAIRGFSARRRRMPSYG